MTIAATAVIVNADRLRAGAGVTIDHYAIVGQPNPYPGVFDADHERDVEIGAESAIGCYALLYEGARLGNRVQLDPRSMVGSRTFLESGVRLMYGAQVHDHVAIGRDTFVGGFVSDNCRIGAGCHVFGSLVHAFRKPAENDWDTTDEPGPILGDNVIVGWGAILIGAIRIGSGARIKPGAVLRRSLKENERYE
jgi:UDP-3-O-[3-hydroxymyristoyl] glucosamine N-acyltransferase